jgi:hypothetical protein
MPVSVRPTGVICPNFVYQDKSNTFGRLKEFLFETNTGRTDVLFIASVGSGNESNKYEYTDDPDLYHYTGGLIDGIAKALIQGNQNWTGRPLYATPVFRGWNTHYVPNLDRYNSNTWNNPNTTGIGNFISGCSTFYNNILYYQNNSLNKKSTGMDCLAFASTSAPNIQNLYSYDAAGEESITDSSYRTFLLNCTNFGVPINTIDKAYEAGLITSVTCCALTEQNIIDVTDPTKLLPLGFGFSFTPNQPTRYYNKDASWTVERGALWYIGIGFLDPVTNTVSEIFSNAQTYGYVPNGVTTGTTFETISGSYYNTLTVTTTIDSLSLCTSPLIKLTTDVNSTTTNASLYWGDFRQDQLTNESKSYLQNQLLGKQILVRKLTTEDLITKFNLTILANKAAITNETAWDNCDGVYLDAVTVLIKKAFPTANYRTLPLTNQILFLDQNYLRVFGLCIPTNPAVATGQEGYPFLITYGIRAQRSFLNNFEPYTSYNTFRSAGTPAFISGDKVNGFPLTLNCMGFQSNFLLTQFDTNALQDVNTTIDKDRGIIIKPQLGKFFDSLQVNNGLYTPLTKTLTQEERNNKLGIFKSANFTYVVNAVTPKSYVNEPGIYNPAANIVLTGHYLPASKQASLTQIIPGENFNLPNTPNPNLTSPRGFNYHTISKVFDLSTINTNHDIREIRLGFVGKGTAHITKGNLFVNSHYAIDPNNQHGIAFTVVERSYLSRTGDDAYRNADGDYPILHHFQEILKAIKYRQNNFGSINTKNKIVVFYEVGLWELADLTAVYNGAGAYDYLASIVYGNPFFRVQYPHDRNSLIGALEQAAINVGISFQDFVVVFYTPTALTRTDLPGFGTAHAVDFSIKANVENFIKNPLSRANFIRASEIFYNNVITECGFYNSCLPNAIVAQGKVPFGNSCYINLGQISSIVAPLNNIQSGDLWYERLDAESGIAFYNSYSAEANLAIGTNLVEYIRGGTSTVNFVPFWFTTFSKMLGYTTDPVSGAEFAFVTPSLDITDDTAYMVEFDAILNNPSNAAFTQASNTISLVKHKILQ